jgi:hypothetical protein
MLDTVDRDLQLTLDDVPDLLLVVPVLRKRGRVGGDVVVRERHVLGMKEAPVPARERLGRQHLPWIDEGHPRRLRVESRAV